jgi:hypothetical protein
MERSRSLLSPLWKLKYTQENSDHETAIKKQAEVDLP